MKRLNAIVKLFLLGLGLVIFSTACGPAEWGETSIDGEGYKVYFKMPKPFRRAEGRVDLKTGRTPYEFGYVTEGDEDNKFQIRVLEMAVGSWVMDGFNPRGVLEFALSRDSAPSEKTLYIQEFKDPNLPENVKPGMEFTIESADGKTIRYTRIVIYETGAEYDAYACYVVLSATRPKDEPRGPYVDKFFNSLRICKDDKTPGRC